MTCRSCQRDLSSYLDGDLASRRAGAIAAHLAACGLCAAVRDELAQVCGLLSSLPREVNPGDALWARIDAGLDAAERTQEARRSRWPRLVPAVGGAALLAAAVATSAVRGSAGRREAAALDAALAAEAAREVSEGIARIEALRAPGSGSARPWQVFSPTPEQDLLQQLVGHATGVLGERLAGLEASLASGSDRLPLPLVERIADGPEVDGDDPPARPRGER